MTVFAARDDNKTPPKHVEADTDVVSGRGFDSPRLHSTRCARSWQAPLSGAACRQQKQPFDRGALSSESKGSDLEAPVGSTRVPLRCTDMHHVYILRCSVGSYYVGVADDIPVRVERHNAGRGSLWTRKRRPVTLMYSESFPTIQLAESRERQLKGWSRAKKEALIAADTARLKQLSLCHSQHVTPVHHEN
jgi:putative endonuclease